MPRSSSADDLNRYARELIRRWEAEGHTATALAERIGVTQSFISQVKAERVKMGLDPLVKLGEVFGMNLADFVEQAQAWARGQRGETTPPDPFPKRLAAVAFAEANNLPEEAIRRVLAYEVKSAAELSAWDWFDLMRHEARRMEITGEPATRATPEAERRRQEESVRLATEKPKSRKK